MLSLLQAMESESDCDEATFATTQAGEYSASDAEGVEAHSAPAPRRRALPDWGKPGAFPVVPADLGELKQHSIDF